MSEEAAAADQTKLAEIYGRLGQIGAAAAEARAAIILTGLGFTQEMQVQLVRSISGISKANETLRRAATFAGALFSSSV